MDYQVGDVIETTDWTPDYDGLYVILEIYGPASFHCRQIFCRKALGNQDTRSFSSGKNIKIGHIDDLTNFSLE